jgi:hypothetical protein
LCGFSSLFFSIKNSPTTFGGTDYTKNLTMRSVRVKSRVKEIDTGILNAAMQRRRDDASRADFGAAEYKSAMAQLEDPTRFTHRWLTRRTREFPLGEDRAFVESTTALNQ